MSGPIYLDHHATTPCDPRVYEKMKPYFTEVFGNAASRTHGFGRQAKEAVTLARKEVAALIGAKPSEILFTSGASEANNLVISGIARRYGKKGKHMITAATEHPSVIKPMQRLIEDGFEITVLSVDSNGHIDLEELKASIRDTTILMSFMHANNEIGTIHPIAEMGAIAKEHGVLFHCDATQSLARENADVREMNIDLLSLSGHKMYGPKGVGAVYARKGVEMESYILGAPQERNLRAGTLNVPAIVGLGETARIARCDLEKDVQHLRSLRDSFRELLMRDLDGLVFNGPEKNRLPHNLNIQFKGVDAEKLMQCLYDAVAISNGSACSSASIDPSRVLTAIGIAREDALESVRIGFGRFNTQEEVVRAKDAFVQAVGSLRNVA